MEKLEKGKVFEVSTEVTLDLTINRMGRKGAEVLSTPSLLKLMEECCIDASDSLIPNGHTTVGYAVDGMRHLAPTPIGAVVKIKSELLEVDGNKLTYALEAFEGGNKIGFATHKRAVIAKT